MPENAGAFLGSENQRFSVSQKILFSGLGAAIIA
jgi:hypothetical protein